MTYEHWNQLLQNVKEQLDTLESDGGWTLYWNILEDMKRLKNEWFFNLGDQFEGDRTQNDLIVNSLCDRLEKFRSNANREYLSLAEFYTRINLVSSHTINQRGYQITYVGSITSAYEYDVRRDGEFICKMILWISGEFPFHLWATIEILQQGKSEGKFGVSENIIDILDGC